MGDAGGTLELVLFTTRAEEIERARRAGIDAVIVDWEWRDKDRRQRGAGTEINHDTPEDLARLRELGVARRFCRINRFGPWTEAEIDAAVEAGATHLLLPMVERPDEVEAVLDWTRRAAGAGECRVGILVETQAGIERAEELARLPLDRVYCGLNDLAISRGAASLFEAVADGTVEWLAHVFRAHRFGFGGVTVVDGGAPVPCRLLLAEMSRLGASFSFLRRSFKRDLAGRDAAGWRIEVARVRELWSALEARDPAERERDRAALGRAIGCASGDQGAAATALET